MIVTADTSPLHYLILLDHSEVLQRLYGSVIIPEAVVRELQAEKTPGPVRQWVATPPEWLQIRQITVPPDAMLAELDPGEREAIALAEALHADALIIDEKVGRREAERRKLRVIGTVRVLDDAAEAGLIDLFHGTPAFTRIRLLSGHEALAISAGSRFRARTQDKKLRSVVRHKS